MSLESVINQTYFSEATIKDAVAKFNHENKGNDVQIKLSKAMLTLEGTEYSRRRLFHRFAGEQLRSLGRLQPGPFNLAHLIPNISIDSLQQIITSVVNKKDLVINGYEMNDLLLHYAISINRIMQGNSYSQFIQNKGLKSREEYELTLQITDRLFQQFNLRFNEYEVSALTLALVGKTIARDTNKQGIEDLEQYVPKRVVDACLQVIDKTSHEYNLQLNDPSFQVRFIIHVNNMVSRVRFGQSPQTEDFSQLTQQYPLLYEMALYMLEALSDELHLTIDHCESVYLLLHLGAYLENDQHHLINAVVVVPEYYDMATSLLERLDDVFGHELRVTQVMQDIPGGGIQFDSRLIITTQSLKTMPDQRVVRVSPLLSSIDIARLHKEIDQIAHQDWVLKNIGYLHRYLSRDLFFNHMQFKTKQEALDFGAQQFESQGYTDDKFIHEILKREKLAATNFGNVAIPHTMRMKAKHTVMLVIMNDKPIKWSAESSCRLIIMIAVSNKAVHVFGELLQVMISALSIKHNVELLLACDDYDQFATQFADMFSKVRREDI
ncbi:hypothetical protein FD19_GL001743 [Lacticaseibacillus thailandensis DSM 22698 = JCM 13996]|uniref:Uncharacterized protein n=1 Tax=Lacticaseibacillus thailandensis DSM 22698 = JCM 13996 TaxID=1423810 RepID=A0A0R2C500_9LACO|nr:hypothetical protein FD19_GL001743 [Lacticaseibacillus thailandensis DSM 22698 = JCM 13996]